MKPISFLSDYGLTDEFVGVCHGVIHQLAPQSRVIDIAHGIPAHDVRAGSLALVRAVQYLPDGIVLAVVDPGVGTTRRGVAVQAGPMTFVGPDNGLLAPAVAMLGGANLAVSLTNDDLHLGAPGATFAGRDVFAPVAARLAAGTALLDVGDVVDPISLIPGVLPLCRHEDGVVKGEALWVDRFGNVQLNIGPDDLAGMGTGIGDVYSLTWGAKTRTAQLVAAYGDITADVGLVIDSYGLVSVCVDRRNASIELGLGSGSSVEVGPAV